MGEAEIVTDGITEDLQAARLLAPAYAGREGELTAVLQYVFQSVVLGGLGLTELSGQIMQIASAEMRHLEFIGSMILKLGAAPVYTACPPYPVGYYSASCVNYTRVPRQMICADICGEENAITQYERILCKLKNGPVAAVVARILAEEKEHLSILNGMLERL